ncbi:MAG: HslU--HslV peptidase proteolytic subunit [Candidatus Puniceispirillum sp.]|nr:HslU--HslV peptidase proteolytic subunit [Candidatus Puniceispirillum sp.]
MQNTSSSLPSWRGTTVLSVRKGNQVVVAADGQITFGNITLKSNARKVRRTGDGNVVVGFAGATADALTLFERLESKLEQYPSQLMRACVELAKEWRTDKYLRKLEAMMAVVDANVSLILTGNGDVLEPEDGLIGIGSGGPYALAAARALKDVEGLSAQDIARKSMEVAAHMCIYSNANILIESIEIPS